MKTRTRILAAAAGAAAIAALAWAFAPRPLEVETAAASVGPFSAGIEELGKTRLRTRYVVSAPLAGQLARITLQEGDAVEAGAVLARLQPVLSPLLDERTRREQELRVQIAQAQVQRAQARVEGARVGLQQAVGEQRRSEQLAGQGFVAATKAETDRLSALAARKELDAAESEARVAAHEVAQARAALQAVASPLSARAFELRAPVSGRVMRVLQASEGAVALGTPLIEVGDTQALEIVAELLTADALRAAPGSAVAIDGWGGAATLQGRVRRVEPSAFTKVSALGVEEQRVKVLIDITSPPPEWAALGDGFRVQLRIVTLALEQVLRVPVSAVFPLPDEAGQPAGRQAVFVVEGGRVRLQPLQVGARDGAAAWVRDGLQAGQTVVVYPPATLHDGARVKVRKV